MQRVLLAAGAFVLLASCAQVPTRQLTFDLTDQHVTVMMSAASPPDNPAAFSFESWNSVVTVPQDDDPPSGPTRHVPRGNPYPGIVMDEPRTDFPRSNTATTARATRPLSEQIQLLLARQSLWLQVSSLDLTIEESTTLDTSSSSTYRLHLDILVPGK